MLFINVIEKRSLVTCCTSLYLVPCDTTLHRPTSVRLHPPHRLLHHLPHPPPRSAFPISKSTVRPFRLRPIAASIFFAATPLNPYHRPRLLLRRPRHLRHISCASSFHEKKIKEERSVQAEEITKKTKSSAAVVCASGTASSLPLRPSLLHRFHLRRFPILC